MTNYENKLDNPAWYSLSETHKQFEIEFGDVKFYPPEYCQFGGYMTSDDIFDSIIQYSKLCSSFYIMGQKPNIPEGFKIEQEVDCFQMIINDKITLPIDETIIELKAEYLKDVLDLVAIAYPNFFQKKTLLLGKNFGVFKNNQLVAITGERMKMNKYTEVSAVITHPEHTGNGYANQLITHTTNQIFKENKTPYLHVAKTNNKAISLYKKLGFHVRREITFWGIKKTE